MQERRQPPDLELRATVDEHVGLAQLDDEAGPRIDEVRIFGRLRQDGDIDIIAADLARDRSEVGQSRDDINFGLRRESPGQPEECQGECLDDIWFHKWSLLRRKDYASEFVRAVRAEDEFELEENRISFALGEEIVRL